jgi:hypothetical protein
LTGGDLPPSPTAACPGRVASRSGRGKGANILETIMQASRGEPGDQQTVVKTTNQARQGVTGHNVRYVLTVGTVLAVAAMVLVWLAFFR